MTDRERFLKCVLGEPVDRPPYWLFWSPWGRAWQRWEREGKPANLDSWQAVRRHFGADGVPAVVPVIFGPCPKIERQVIAETDEDVIFIDPWGIKRRDLKANESMSQFLEFPVKDQRDWEAYRDQYLDPDDPRRLAGDWRAQCAEARAAGRPIQLGHFPELTVFGGLRWLLGDEECLLAFYTMPDLVHEIIDHLTSIFVTVIDKVAREVRIDMVHIWEDMCGRQGPLISPRHWEEFMGPCYRRIKAVADEHGIPVISVDTDGRPDLIIPPMIESGVNYLLPFEVAAGCDVNEAQPRFPGLAMMGGIDKRALAEGPAAIDRELARIRPAVARGRYIPDLDHLVPDDVPWPNFCHYAAGLRELVAGG